MNVVVILTIVLIILLLMLFRHVTRNFRYWENRNIPYVEPIPFLGNIARVITQKASIAVFLHEIYNTTKSPYLGFFVLDKPILLIRSPKLIKSVLIKHFDSFSDRFVAVNNNVDSLGSNMLFLMKNPTWKQLRPKFAPIFSVAKIKNMFPFMEEASDELTAYIANMFANKKSVMTMEICGKYATDIISSCAFGVNSHCFKYENAEFRVMAKRLFDHGFKRTAQMASYFFAPSLVKPFGLKIIEPVAGNFMKNTFWKILSDRELSKTVRGDLIDCSIQIRREQQNSEHKLDGDVLAAQAVMFFMVGFETTGTTIAWVLYELSLNFEIQSRLRQEINSSYQENGKFSYDIVQNMKYLNMVVNETVRKYPTLPFVERRCGKNFQLDTDVVIEKGIPVYIALLGLHYDPEYFPNPNKFDPERFSEKNKVSIPDNTYLPFGDGPRMCAGPKFSSWGVKVAVVKILTEFQIEPTESTPVPPIFMGKVYCLHQLGICI